MNDTDAKRLLRQLQYQEHARSGTLAAQTAQTQERGSDGIPPHMVEQLKKLYGIEGFKKLQQEGKEKEAQLQSRLPTDMQNMNTFTIIFELAQNIEAALPEMNYHLPLRPVIGTLHTDQMYGLAINVKSSSEYLVLVNSDLFTFALLLSKMVARSFPVLPEGGFSTEPEQSIKALQSSGALNSFFDLLMAYLMVGAPGAAKPYVVEDRAIQALSQILVDSIEYFALGHEYGHILSNHLAGETQMTSLQGDAVETLRRSWKDEIQADSIGVMLTLYVMRHRRNVDVSLAFLGAYLFLLMMDIVEKSAWMLVHGTDKVDYKRDISSPPPMLRLYSLSKTIEASLPKELYDEAARLANDGHALLAYAYEAVKPQLLKMHQEKKRPAPIWQAFVQRLSS